MLLKKYQKWLLLALLTGFFAFYGINIAFASTEYFLPATADYYFWVDASSDMCSDFDGELYYMAGSNDIFSLTGQNCAYLDCTSYDICTNGFNASPYPYSQSLEYLTPATPDSGLFRIGFYKGGYAAPLGEEMGHAFFYRFSEYNWEGKNDISTFITISDPANGSTITATSEMLTGNYYNIDRNFYDGFLMNWRDEKLHLSTNSYDFQFASSDTGTGNFSIPINDFGFDTNGHWDLTAIAYGQSLDIQNELFLTGRGYVSIFSNELINPPYYLIFNVAGLLDPFSFENYGDWYNTNVSDYATPSDIFNKFGGYLQPYFEKVGGFGATTMLYFNLNEAYDRGFGLGSVFPTIEAYTQKIEIFFGGFPIFTFFKYLLATLMALFIVRTILKFIPFIG